MANEKERYIVISKKTPAEEERYLKLSAHESQKSRKRSATSPSAESPHPESPPSKLSIPSKDKTPKSGTKTTTGVKSVLDRTGRKSKSRQFSTSPGTKSSTRSADAFAPSTSHEKLEDEAIRRKRRFVNRLIVGLSAGHVVTSIAICVAAYVAQRNLGADEVVDSLDADGFGFLNRTGKIHDESRKLIDACYRKTSTIESHEALISCTYLNRSLHYNCFNVTCMRADHSFSPALGRFVDNPVIGPTLAPGVGDRCADDPNYKCRDPNREQYFFCLDHMTRLLAHPNFELPETKLTGPLWVDGCGRPDSCTVYSRDSFIRSLILAGKPNFKMLTSCVEIADTCDKDFRDAVIRVRFLHCATRFKLGERYCPGSPVRFEICHKCPFMYYKPSIVSPYWDFNMCGTMNYDYSIGCRVHCIDGSTRMKPNGRLCQPSVARFDYLHTISPARPVSEMSGGPSYYMCFQGECVEVHEDGGDIPFKHCHRNLRRHHFVNLPKETSSMFFH